MGAEDQRKKRYEDIYSQNECVFGREPLAIVKKIPEILARGTVFDCGAGEGRNAIFLAKQGYRVTAVDYAQTGVEKIRRRAEEEQIENISVYEGDLRTVEIPANQDIILATLVLHTMIREEARAFIERIKHAAPEGGRIALEVITKDSDFYRDFPDTENFFPDPGEIQTYFTGWEIEPFLPRVWKAFRTRSDGTAFMNTSEGIIARKPIRRNSQ